jgi:hypothetical protein
MILIQQKIDITLPIKGSFNNIKLVKILNIIYFKYY